MTKTLIPPGTIVVGLDGSPSADRALDWAIAQAVREHRQLTLAHAIDEVGSAWADPMSASRPSVIEALHADAAATLAAARAVVTKQAPDLAVHETTWAVDPRTMLLELAESAALVVVGSRGRGPVARLLLGSVGVAVVRHARCPIVVVRQGHPGLVRNGVVVGADASVNSRATVEHAYRQASLRQLPLTILHCTWAGGAGTTEDDLRLPVAEPLTGLAEKFPDVRARLEVVQGVPDQELIAASRRMDLVVVGAHHGGLLSTLVNGSVANSVVEHAECAVLVVPVARED